MATATKPRLQPFDYVTVKLNVEDYPNLREKGYTDHMAQRGRDIPSGVHFDDNGVKVESGGGHEVIKKKYRFEEGKQYNIPYGVYIHLCGDRERKPGETDTVYEQRVKEEIRRVRDRRMYDVYNEVNECKDRFKEEGLFIVREGNDVPPVLTIVGTEFDNSADEEEEVQEPDAQATDYTKLSRNELVRLAGELKEEKGIQFNHNFAKTETLVYFLTNKALPEAGESEG